MPCTSPPPCWTRIASPPPPPRRAVQAVKATFAVGVTRGREARTSRRAAPKPRQTLRIPPHSPRFPRQSAPSRPRFRHEDALSWPPRRRRAISESSCGTPMRAASLTKGYGGNPPSGRSVSPPRTGPFFLPKQPEPRRPTNHGTHSKGRGAVFDLRLRRVGATSPHSPAPATQHQPPPTQGAPQPPAPHNHGPSPAGVRFAGRRPPPGQQPPSTAQRATRTTPQRPRACPIRTEGLTIT